MNIQKELRALEKQKARIARKEKALHDQAKAHKAVDAMLENIVKSCGLSPRDLVFALADKYSVRLAGRRKGSTGKRKRTKITAALRDAIKKTVKGGQSMFATAKQFDISYAVVIKMVRGGYDKLK